MEQVDPIPTRRKGLWTTLAITTVTGASAVAIALPAPSSADPEVPTPVPPTTAAAPPVGPNGQPAPADPNAVPPPPANPIVAPPPPVDPNVPPPPPADPNAGRITNAVGGFSYVLPAGWVESDASHLDYGSALLSKVTGPPPLPDQPPAVANDTRIVMGRLDQKLYASAEANNAKAAVRLGSDMGEFFMPYPGTRINQDATPLNGSNGSTGSASYYEVKFSDAAKPNGQIWTGVIGSANGGTAQRWFVVWLGTSNDPVDRGAAKALTESIQAWTPPAAPPAAPGVPAPAPAAPVPPGPPAPAPAAPAAPAPAAPAAPGAPAPASEVTPTPTPAPQQTLSA
ncbi:alanine and proline-rich secreted protein Apa [Mycobacterium sp. 94-17]|uniref:alanine and proline-rich secreted protein Apa n=1 Tax=Mycobacterium sp. 94-17 TaxID=2986147 RepID=UPI002D1E566C|nr:alanine and proline-rich secreted protein Apa [Mycobacterium sp. 94-17]MEB4209971.1 alanine and proline-rich secreted protein Apa [Mycobacterium sp. 94-17]